MAEDINLIQPIDIPAARQQIVNEIATARLKHQMATIVEEFLLALPPLKKPNAQKLHQMFVERHPELQVSRVLYKAGITPATGRPEFTLIVESYAMPTGTFVVRTLEDGSRDVDGALIADRQWLRNAEYLSAHLKNFPYNAQRFNQHLEELRKHAAMAVPPDAMHGIFPLTGIYSWYELGGPAK